MKVLLIIIAVIALCSVFLANVNHKPQIGDDYN